MTTITELFATAVAAREAEPALQTADGTIAWTWGEYGRQAAAAATGLAGLGIGRGDVVACWLSNRPEFHAADMGAALLGAASFSVYPTYTAEQAAHVMRSYRNRPDATAEAIDVEGWLHSGDVGVFDEDGYLRIVDRIKEIIINAAGKNMSPANIESTVKVAGSLIGNICTIGDGRPYNVALLTLDPDSARGRNANDPEVVAEVQAQIARANERLARVEQIKRFAVLDEDWVPGGDELTPTSKLKRRVIADKYQDRIDALYV